MNTLGIFDMYTDHGAYLKHALDGRKPPELFKTAMDMSTVQRKDPNDYAVATETSNGSVYMYPIVDPANALISAIYFAECADRMPEGLRKEAAAKLSVALQTFGLSVPAELTKTAAIQLGYSDEAGNNTGDMVLERLFGIDKDPTVEVDRSALAELSPRGKLQLSFRLKEAGLLSTAPKALQDYAGNSVGDAFAGAIARRRYATGLNTEAGAELDTIMEKAASLKYRPDLVLEQVEAFDDKYALSRFYGESGKLPDPVASVYGMLEKTASEQKEIVAGIEVTSGKLAALLKEKSAQLRDAYGEDFVAQLSRAPFEVFSSLPNPHKRDIVGLMNDR
jgi:hypothetical protein